MPRIRSIKPSFFQSDDVSVLPLRARLTWIGLWTQCDDQGRMKDHLRLIKAGVWPLDNVSLADIEEDLSTLAACGRIVRYEVGRERFLEVVNWNEHQKINRPTPSRIPPPSNGLAPAREVPNTGAREPRETASATQGALTDDSLNSSPNGSDMDRSYPQDSLTHDSLSPHAGKGGEGKGKEGTRAGAREKPPRRCPRHLDDPDPPPCGQCADARRAHDRWQADQPQGRVELPRETPRCPKHHDQPAGTCGTCRSERLAPT